MKPKTSIKNISLYELIENNDLLIISTIYHLFILIFNYNAIITMNNLQNTFKNFEICFEIIENNLNICQTITFFTLFFVIYISDKIFIKDNTKYRNQILIMTFSFTSKMSIVIYQYYNFSNKDLCFNRDKSVTGEFGAFYDLIEISYILRIIIFFLILLMVIVFPICYTCEHCCKTITEWSKTYKFNIIEQNNNNGSEDV